MAYTSTFDQELFGDFWVRKVHNFHQRLDVDKDGRLSEADFNLIADRLNKQAGLSGKDAQDTKDYFTNSIWKVYFNSTGGDSASSEEWIELLKRDGKKNILATCFNIFNRYFQAIDTDRNGNISLKEFTRFFHILGMNEDLAKQSFVALDTNKDGTISRAEFVHSAAEFFTEENEGNASDLFVGPL